MYRGAFRYITGREKESLSDLSQAIKLSPADSGIAAAYLYLFAILEKHEDYKAKLALCETWAKAQPESFLALNTLAFELLNSHDEKLRDPKRALNLAERASALSNHNESGIEDTRAQALFFAGQVAKACEVEKHAIELLPPDTTDDERTIFLQHQTQFELVKPQDP